MNLYLCTRRPLQPGDLAVLARELGEGRVEQHRYVPLEDLVGLAQLRRLGARARELAVRGGGRRLGAPERRGNASNLPRDGAAQAQPFSYKTVRMLSSHVIYR